MARRMPGVTKQPRMTVVPLMVAAANRVVDRIHRHHAPSPPALVYFALGVVDLDANRICGAAIVGRPANRNSDKGQTGEVLRVATDGTPNAPSVLYGACSQAARRMGFSRLITYTLDSEPGTSLRAAGWTLDKEGIKSYWGTNPEKYAAQGRSVRPLKHLDVTKRRWSISLRDPLVIDSSLSDPEAEPSTDPVLELGL